MRVVQSYKLQKALSEQHQENYSEGWSLEVLCSGGSGSQVALVTLQRGAHAGVFSTGGFSGFFRGYTVPTKKCLRLLGMSGFLQSPLEVVP